MVSGSYSSLKKALGMTAMNILWNLINVFQDGTLLFPVKAAHWA